MGEDEHGPLPLAAVGRARVGVGVPAVPASRPGANPELIAAARPMPLPQSVTGKGIAPKPRGRSPPAFDSEGYAQCTTVERCIARLKQWRDLALRTNKPANAHEAARQLAAILIWARP